MVIILDPDENGNIPFNLVIKGCTNTNIYFVVKKNIIFKLGYPGLDVTVDDGEIIISANDKAFTYKINGGKQIIFKKELTGNEYSSFWYHWKMTMNRPFEENKIITVEELKQYREKERISEPPY